MGRECLDRLAEPLVGGVNGSDPAEMSLAATYPMLLEMEQKHGSLVRGFLAQRKKVEEMREKYPPKPGAKRRTFFTLVPARACSTSPTGWPMRRVASDIRTGVAATALERADGRRVARRRSTTARRSTGDAVIVATEVWAAERARARASTPRSPSCSRTIPCSSSATVAHGLRRRGLPVRQALARHPVAGGRAAAGHRRLAHVVEVAGPRARGPRAAARVRRRAARPGDRSKRSDDELVEITRARSSSSCSASRPDAKPLFARVFRWDGGMPQYTMGHLDRVDEIEARCGEHRRASRSRAAAYRGVGVPNCLESGEKAVSKVLGEWGIDARRGRRRSRSGVY